MGVRIFIIWVALAGSGWAGPREEIASAIRQAAALEATDTEGRLSTEISTLRAWLTEAQHRLTRKDEVGLAQSLARVKAQIELVEALKERAEAEAAARDVRQAAQTLERAATELRRSAAQAEHARAVLEQQEAAQREAPP